MNDRYDEGREVQSMSVEGSTVALLNKSEIDMQVATAHKYPTDGTRLARPADETTPPGGEAAKD